MTSGATASLVFIAGLGCAVTAFVVSGWLGLGAVVVVVVVEVVVVVDFVDAVVVVVPDFVVSP